MNSNLGKQKFFVIYEITNLLDSRIYVGAHSTFNVNDKYMGSSKYLKKDIKELGRQNFKKEILHVFDNKEDMMKMESEIVNKEFCHRSDTYNKMIGGISEMSWNNMITVKDEEGNTSKVYCDDPRYLSGELVGIAKGNQYSKGRVTVKDENGNSFSIFNNDPRFISGELVSIYKGLSQHSNFSWKGKFHKEESKLKIGLANSEKQNGELNSQFGKKRSEEFKQRMKEKFSKKFFVYNKDGIFVSEENNIQEYAKQNGLNPSSIVKVLKGKYKHSNNLKFYYEYQGEYLTGEKNIF